MQEKSCGTESLAETKKSIIDHHDLLISEMKFMMILLLIIKIDFI